MIIMDKQLNARQTGIVDGELDLLDFQENVNALWNYWKTQFITARREKITLNPGQ